MLLIYAFAAEKFHIVHYLFFAFEDLVLITFIKHIGMVSKIDSVWFAKIEVMMGFITVSSQKHDL